MVQPALAKEGTSVVYLEPDRINEETETRDIGREGITFCYPRIFRTSAVLIIAYS